MNGTGQQPTPFVGRTAELEILQQTWQRVEAGEPQFLVWTADTGLGKTRLGDWRKISYQMTPD